MEKSRIYLRAFEPTDYRTTIQWRRDDDIWDMVGGPKYFVSEAYEKKWIEDAVFSSKDVRLAICLKEDDTHIGNIYFTDIDYINRSAHSHIIIGRKDMWGKGYASEAISLGIAYMANQRNIRRFEAKVLKTNEASLKMYEKCGFETEGLLRESVYKNGEYIDQYILGYLKDSSKQL